MNIAASPARFRLAALLLCVAVLAGGCGQGRDDGQTGYLPRIGDQPPVAPDRKEYVFGVLPLHNPSRLFESYGPIVDELNARIPEAHFTLEASRNYETFDRKLYARHFDLALTNPYQTINAHGYRVFGKMGDDAMFRGVILVRRDSGIAKVADLKGKAVSFPAKSALAATMLPQHYLNDHGLAIELYQSRYVGSQDSAIMNAYLGNSAASAAWLPSWKAFERDHPDYAAQLQIQWTTDSLPNNGLVARDDFPPQLIGRVAAVLFSLQDSSTGREMLARLPLSRFEAASNATYLPVREFVAHFSRAVRPLEEVK